MAAALGALGGEWRGGRGALYLSCEEVCRQHGALGEQRAAAAQAAAAASSGEARAESLLDALEQQQQQALQRYLVITPSRAAAGAARCTEYACAYHYLATSSPHYLTASHCLTIPHRTSPHAQALLAEKRRRVHRAELDALCAVRERADGVLRGGAGAGGAGGAGGEGAGAGGAGSTAAAAVSLCGLPLAQALIAAEAEMASRMRHAERLSNPPLPYP
eukprot:scaffold78020_cov36-Phaeocystis_antarctica.AAC.2